MRAENGAMTAAGRAHWLQLRYQMPAAAVASLKQSASGKWTWGLCTGNVPIGDEVEACSATAMAIQEQVISFARSRFPGSISRGPGFTARSTLPRNFLGVIRCQISQPRLENREHNGNPIIYSIRVIMDFHEQNN